MKKGILALIICLSLGCDGPKNDYNINSNNWAANKLWNDKFEWIWHNSTGLDNVTLSSGVEVDVSYDIYPDRHYILFEKEDSSACWLYRENKALGKRYYVVLQVDRHMGNNGCIGGYSKRYKLNELSLDTYTWLMECINEYKWTCKNYYKTNDSKFNSKFRIKETEEFCPPDDFNLWLETKIDTPYPWLRTKIFLVGIDTIDNTIVTNSTDKKSTMIGYTRNYVPRLKIVCSGNVYDVKLTKLKPNRHARYILNGEDNKVDSTVSFGSIKNGTRESRHIDSTVPFNTIFPHN